MPVNAVVRTKDRLFSMTLDATGWLDQSGDDVLRDLVQETCNSCVPDCDFIDCTKLEDSDLRDFLDRFLPEAKYRGDPKRIDIETEVEFDMGAVEIYIQANRPALYDELYCSATPEP